MSTVTTLPDGPRAPAARRSAAVSVAFLAVAVAVPLSVADARWLTVLSFAGIDAVVVIGLNVLTGFAGQLSIGQAAFVGTGAYAAVGFGEQLGWPLAFWLPGAGAVGALVGAAMGPLAVRIRGPALVFVSLAALAGSAYVFNHWESLTGGPAGVPADLPLDVGIVDFARIEIGGTHYETAQGRCVLIWLVVGLALLLQANLRGSRMGLAMRAVRDDETASLSTGIGVARAKVAAFAVAGGLAGLAGALHAAVTGYVTPTSFDLLSSVTYLTALILGGAGTLAGPVVGALALALLPELTGSFGDRLPFVTSSQIDPSAWLTVHQLDQILYGGLLVALVLVEPRGLAALWSRGAAALRTVPDHASP